MKKKEQKAGEVDGGRINAELVNNVNNSDVNNDVTEQCRVNNSSGVNSGVIDNGITTTTTTATGMCSSSGCPDMTENHASLSLASQHQQHQQLRSGPVPENNEQPIIGTNASAKYPVPAAGELQGRESVHATTTTHTLPPFTLPTHTFPKTTPRSTYTGSSGCHTGSSSIHPPLHHTSVSGGGLTSDSSDSMEKSSTTSTTRTGYVRGRHKSYLRDTMQFSFYTGEKSSASSVSSASG